MNLTVLNTLNFSLFSFLNIDLKEDIFLLFYYNPRLLAIIPFMISYVPAKIERSATSLYHLANTAELIFEDAIVPVENLLGEEKKGF